MSLIAEKLHSRRGSVSSVLTMQQPQPIPKSRERSNSITALLNPAENLPEQPKKQVIVEEPCKEKKGLKSLHCIVESLQSKLVQFEQQFKKDNDKITAQEKEISLLKETIKDILDG